MSAFEPNLLKWPMRRERRTFRIFVVEPNEYKPDTHESVFTAVLRDLLIPVASVVRADSMPKPGMATRIDLITFPEAFLPVPALLAALEMVHQVDSWPCVHVGLRPDSTGASHLFNKSALNDLVTAIKALPWTHAEDLIQFENWLVKQDQTLQFNVGCLFARDINGDTRVCLHPKFVRSKFEYNPNAEMHMAEANLLTVVSLIPSNKSLRTVNIQPLLCSDTFFQTSDGASGHPISALNNHADCFAFPPDHIDVVSVATCTPQIYSDRGHVSKTTPLIWNTKFRESFIQSVGDGFCGRHFHSVFVLANFRNIDHKTPGGLSGAFVPMPIAPTELFPPYVSVGAYGRFSSGSPDNNWLPPYNKRQFEPSLESRGYLASLDPYENNENGSVRAIGFTLTRFPRDKSLWSNKPEGLVDFDLRILSTITNEEALS